MRVRFDGMVEKVDHFYLMFLDVHGDHLSFVEHAEDIERVSVIPLPKDLSLLVHMDQFLVAILSCGDIDISVDGGGQLEDF